MGFHIDIRTLKQLYSPSFLPGTSYFLDIRLQPENKEGFDLEVLPAAIVRRNGYQYVFV